MCLKDLRDEFLYDCECRHLAKGSLRNYRAATRFLVDFLELRRITELEEVKPHHIRDLMKEKQDMGSKERVVPKSPALSKQLMKYRTLRDAYLKEYLSRHKNLFLSKNGKPLTDEAVARMLKHTLMSSLRDIKVFTKKEKENEGVGEEGTTPLIQSE